MLEGQYGQRKPRAFRWLRIALLLRAAPDDICGRKMYATLENDFTTIPSRRLLGCYLDGAAPSRSTGQRDHCGQCAADGQPLRAC